MPFNSPILSTAFAVACVIPLIGCDVVTAEERPVARLVYPYYGLTINSLEQKVPRTINDQFNLFNHGRLDSLTFTGVALQQSLAIGDVIQATRLEFASGGDRLFQIERRMVGKNEAVYAEYEETRDAGVAIVALLVIHRPRYNVGILISWPRDEFAMHATLTRTILQNVQLDTKPAEVEQDFPTYRDDRIGLYMRCPDYPIGRKEDAAVQTNFQMVDFDGIASVFLQKGILPDLQEELSIFEKDDNVAHESSKTRTLVVGHSTKGKGYSLARERRVTGIFLTTIVVWGRKGNANPRFSQFARGIEMKGPRK